MKKTHKKIVGFLGLLTVVAVTAVAILLPAPETQATSSVTDTITVRVVNESPDVRIDGLPDGEVITLPVQTFFVYYNNVDTVTLKLTHTDLYGTTVEYDLDTIKADYEEGTQPYIVYFNE